MTTRETLWGAGRIAVVGLGSIGRGVALLIADQGLPLTIFARRRAAAEELAREVERRLARMVRRGLVGAAEAEARRASLRIATEVAELADAELVIEAIAEELGAKRALLADLAAACGPTTIFASTTSAIPIAALVDDPAIARRTLGLHFLAPVRLTGVVEVIRGPASAEAALGRASELCRALGREPHALRRSVVNLLVIAYVAEGLALCAEGAPPLELEAWLRAAGFGLGPLATLDLIGLDVAMAVIDGADPLTAPADPRMTSILRALRDRGALGRKAGAGLLCDDGEAISPRFVELLDARPATLDSAVIEARVWTRLLGEFLLCVAHDLGTVRAIDALAAEVLGLEVGLRARLGAVEPGPLLAALAALEARLGGRYAPSEGLLRAALRDPG